ncbi:LLM class flavin-dependent oxidoreductase [Rhodospirillales bacterium]|nr:LLM class flavin-dependent oxidoreductase [Rhodospirillales bacterium]
MKKFEIGLFALNAGSGLAMTLSDDRWQATWENVSATVKLADTSGIDFVLPLQTWRGYGGETNPAGWCMETFSTASAIAAITERIRVFCTIHVPFIHPTYAARAIATLDQISNGRAGANIVCGWNPDEFAMFSLADYEHATRYEQGSEWVQVFNALLENADPINFAGQFYNVSNGVCIPSSVNGRHVPLVSAAYSKSGREFAQKHCDMMLTIFSDVDIARDQIQKENHQSKNNGSTMGFYTTGHVIARSTRKEAEDYYKHIANELADNDAVEQYMSTKKLHNPVLANLQKLQLLKMAGGAGTYPLVGSYDEVAQKLKDIQTAGFRGIALSFINYLEELPAFTSNVLPQLPRDIS